MKKLTEDHMHSYQHYSKEHIIKNKYSALFIDMGLGKTVSTLTAINQLMYHDFEVNKVLVIAPLNVALTVWQDEIEKWEHLNHMTFSLIHGPSYVRAMAIEKQADIYIINRENVTWLIAHLNGSFPWDMLVIDEISSFKSHDSKRFKALKMVRPLIKRVVGLTGTPAGNGLVDLWPEMYLIDMGQRLGKTITFFRQHYLTPLSQVGYVVHKYGCSEVAEKAIYDKIKDITISLKAEDYLKLPERVENVIKIKLSEETKELYDKFEEEQVMMLFNLEEDEVEISALNAAALRNKLLQFANGAVYENAAVDMDGKLRRQWHTVHEEKMNALAELLEQNTGQNVLIFYQFRHDLERIIKRFKARQLKGKEDIVAWNAGKVPIMIAHAASAGHGLNLQAGGSNIIWYGLTDSLELYMQANARLHRQGQLKPVYIHKLLCAGTFDYDVLNNLKGKATRQDRLMDAVKVIVNKYKSENKPMHILSSGK